MTKYNFNQYNFTVKNFDEWMNERKEINRVERVEVKNTAAQEPVQETVQEPVQEPVQETENVSVTNSDSIVDGKSEQPLFKPPTSPKKRGRKKGSGSNSKTLKKIDLSKDDKNANDKSRGEV